MYVNEPIKISWRSNDKWLFYEVFKTDGESGLSTSMTVRGFYNKSYTSQKTYFIINSSTIYVNEPIKISWRFNNKWFYHEVFKTDGKSGLSTSTTVRKFHWTFLS